MKHQKKLPALLLCFCLLFSSCASDSATAETDVSNASVISLADDGIALDGKAVTEDSSAAVYIANDIVYYPEGMDFTFGEGTQEDEHSQEEADAHTVVHITQPGAYVLTGTLSAGQIAVDLGENAKEDPNAVVTLVLDNVDITCTVAPAIIFYNVYECGSTDAETATYEVDTGAAGANVIIADDSSNAVSGSYVARIYESVELSEDGTKVADGKTLHKYDGAFYSQMSMNIFGGEEGSGELFINGENEGLDSELHLTINGGNLNITSGNDGINTNEDGVSVTTINGGSLLINVSGTTGEGDGIDSNGWLVINGGSVYASACADSLDAGIDSDMGIYINGGTVAAAGHMLDALVDGTQNYAVFTINDIETANELFTIRNESGDAVLECGFANEFCILVVSSPKLTEGTYTLWQGDTDAAMTQLRVTSAGRIGGFGGARSSFSDHFERKDMERPEIPQMPEGAEIPQGGEAPEDMELPDEAEMPENGFFGREMPELPERTDPPQRDERTERSIEERTDRTAESARERRGISDSSEETEEIEETSDSSFLISNGGNYFRVRAN